MHCVAIGTKRQMAAAHQFGRYREATRELRLMGPPNYGKLAYVLSRAGRKLCAAVKGLALDDLHKHQ